MAVTPPIAEPEPGAPIPRDSIDPDLIKLARKRSQIGIITAIGVIVVCVFYILDLAPDRRFGREPEVPRAVALADVAAGKIPDDSFISIDTDPMMSHAIRASTPGVDPGFRVVPARGTGERVWLVLDGNAGLKPNLKSYVGRLRRISDLKSARVLDTHARAYPRPTFATAAAVRAGLASGTVETVAGDRISVGAADRVAFDVIDPAHATIIASFTGPRAPTEESPGHGPLTDGKAWIAELAKHGITAVPSPVPGQVDSIIGQIRLDVALSVDAVTEKLEAAKLWAARVERVMHHHETTWGALRASPATGFTVSGRTVPDAEVGLIGLFVQRGIPGDAYALLAGEHPQDYWYVQPITLVLGFIGLLFAWALARALRDLLPARAR